MSTEHWVGDNVVYTNPPYAFTIHFSDAEEPTLMSLSPLIQINLPRRNNDAFTSVIWNYLIFRYTGNWILLSLSYHMIWLSNQANTHTCPSRQTPKPFFITICHQTNLPFRENYAYELHQVMILNLSRAGLTSWNQIISHGRVHFTHSQNFIILYMKNWGKIDLFQTTWTQLSRIFILKSPNIAELNIFIH